MDYFTAAENFMAELPYRQGDYGRRNWGHPWHSLCSYHGKLKPAIAYFLVDMFTNRNDVILDPLSGVGTIPFEACLQGRKGIGNDLSKMAYVITRAKIEHPNKAEVIPVLDELSDFIESNKQRYNVDPPLYHDFGFNGKIPEYFHKDTYAEILAAREYFKNRTLSSGECMVMASLLHVLHGNRPYALSRNSHPLTPYKPTGNYVYKNVIGHINEKLNISYNKVDLHNVSTGYAINGDFNNLPQILPEKVDSIITSPPFSGSIRFYVQNWMRLWCSGWEIDDFKKANMDFLEAKQKKSMDIYYSFFEMCANVLKPHGRVILHLGNSKECNMADELEIRSQNYFETIYKGAENVASLEKHGIKDKGATFEHQFLFLQKKDT